MIPVTLTGILRYNVFPNSSYKTKASVNKQKKSKNKNLVLCLILVFEQMTL